MTPPPSPLLLISIVTMLNATEFERANKCASLKISGSSNDALHFKLSVTKVKL